MFSSTREMSPPTRFHPQPSKPGHRNDGSPPPPPLYLAVPRRSCRLHPLLVLTGGKDARRRAGVGAHNTRVYDLGGTAVSRSQGGGVGGGATDSAALAALGHTAHVKRRGLNAGDAAGASLCACSDALKIATAVDEARSGGRVGGSGEAGKGKQAGHGLEMCGTHKINRNNEKRNKNT